MKAVHLPRDRPICLKNRKNSVFRAMVLSEGTVASEQMAFNQKRDCDSPHEHCGGRNNDSKALEMTRPTVLGVQARSVGTDYDCRS